MRPWLGGYDSDGDFSVRHNGVAVVVDVGKEVMLYVLSGFVSVGLQGIRYTRVYIPCRQRKVGHQLTLTFAKPVRYGELEYRSSSRCFHRPRRMEFETRCHSQETQQHTQLPTIRGTYFPVCFTSPRDVHPWSNTLHIGRPKRHPSRRRHPALQRPRR